MSDLFQLALSDSELHLCKTLCQGAFLCIGVHLGLGGMVRGEQSPIQQPSPLVSGVMSILDVDEKRALGFCDAQILSGADEFFSVLRDSATMPEVSHNIRIHMEKLHEYLPYEVLPPVFSPPKQKVEDEGREGQVRHDSPDALNDTEVTSNSEMSIASKPISMDEKAWQIIASPLPAPSLEPIIAPFDYVCSLKSKGVRNKLIRALTAWIPMSEARLEFTMSLIADVHNTSLIPAYDQADRESRLDDVQDNSPLRRSCPATHTIFGVAQTVNSAVYQTVNLINRAFNSGNLFLTKELIAGIESLLVGQSLDLAWTQEVNLPTVEEYLQMIDGKTGALFVMIYRLMAAVSLTEKPLPNLDRFMLLLGRYFQIRDDYLNLASPKYTEAKGFCEDLDEGKCSFVILHVMNNAKPRSRTILRNILLQRRNGSLGIGHKETILAIIEETGSLGFSKLLMQRLEDEMFKELETIEAATGERNPALMGLMDALRS
ncbi:uncharacterized protein PgNI_02069 [Pyricularia grisea]|uniref:Uncharacterized protein n=1 Tax=Pyricularia grisea TaxID=148305 RepID=A0A6P8BGE1_PYRGI|nr:uncharacterized protein PgNI_02069 [Pyricularia grisea]TLD15775.1 hypothetical protein PgNI_02069 [Pyricularia grisea]